MTRLSVATTEVLTTPQPVILDFKPLLRKLDDDDFFEFCQANHELRIEHTKEGDVIVMPPTGGETGGSNFDLTVEFRNWVKADGTGKGFDSSTGFALPNGDKRSPDLSWVKLDRWNVLTDEERRKFPPSVRTSLSSFARRLTRSII